MERLSVLFWNARRNDRTCPVLAACEHDIVTVAEAPHGLSEWMEVSGFHLLRSEGRRPLEIWFRPRACEVEEVLVSGHGLVLTRVTPPNAAAAFTLGLVHMRSKLHTDDLALVDQARRCAEIVGNEEDRSGHRHTLIVGDFNVDPFHAGMIGHSGWNAIMCARTASVRSGERVQQGEVRRTFYNPCWSLLGDRSEGPPGSFFDDRGAARTWWHSPDQLLVRPCLAGRVTKVRVRDSLGDAMLLTSDGRPAREQWSDHLPLEFEIECSDE